MASKIREAAAAVRRGTAWREVGARERGAPPAAEVEAFLVRVPLFAGLPACARRQLARSAHWRTLAAGEFLFHQGDPPAGLALVWSGRLEVLHEDGDGHRHRPLAELTRGAWTGELGLLTGAPRSASIRAARDTTLVMIEGATFHRLLDAEPALGVVLARTLAVQVQRLQVRPEQPHQPDTLCVLALDERVPFERARNAFVRGLASASTAIVGPGDLGPREDWTAALDRTEDRHDHVVLCVPSPAPDDPWTSFCTRSADRVLALTTSTRTPRWDPTDLRDVDLVVLASGTPVGLADAVDALSARAHHLVPLDARFDEALARTARRVTGRAIGVVFSGGGARGLAHLGAMARLRAAGVPVDRVGGTSAGAIAAALTAMQLTVEDATELCRQELVDRNPFTDVTVPREGLIRGRKVAAMLERMFGERRLEELALPTFAVSSDLTDGTLVVHRRGPVTDAVAASMCIPGLAPPVRLDGRLLVDGGLLDNLPVGVMASDGEGPVIAIDAMRSYPAAVTAEALPVDPAAALGDEGAGRRRDRWFGGPASPSIVSILARSLVLGGRAKVDENRRSADLLVSPDLESIGLFDFARIDEIVAAGRVATDEALGAALVGLLTAGSARTSS